MKIIKIMLVVLLMSASVSQAQDAATGKIDLYEATEMVDSGLEIIDTRVASEIPQRDNAAFSTAEEPGVLMKDEFLIILSTFISSGILAFIMMMLFPKFFKKTGAVLTEEKKLSIVFEAMKAIFVLITVSLLGVFLMQRLLMIALYPSIIATLLALFLYFIGMPIFSIGVLEWLLGRKGIKFEKLNKKQQLVSLVAMNIIIMMFVLPVALLAPEFQVELAGEQGQVDVFANLMTFVISMLGMGMFATHLKAVLIKNKKKL